MSNDPNRGWIADPDALASAGQKLHLLRDRVTGVVNGLQTGLYVYGAGGIGKSHTVLDQLDRLGATYRLFNSRMTGKGLFRSLKEGAGAVHVLEDMERLTNDKDGQGVLRSALWATQGRARVVTWTTGDKTDEFTFSGGVILLANRPLAALPELKALATRIAVYHLEVTDLELSSMLCELTAAGYRRGDKLVLQPETCAEIGSYLLNECRTAACPLDLRMLFNAYHDYLLWEADQTRCHWQDLVSTRVRETASTFKHEAEESSVEEKKAQCRKAVREIMKITKVASEQIELYYKRTGKSRADFYRHKNEVLSGEFNSEAPPEENAA